jgi:uncharacterized YigZ family protein
MNYRTIKENGIVEEEIKKSRFICHLKRISSESEGRDFINKIKKEHYKANHSCSAMIVGEDSFIKRSSDDGEPSGTAGIPMLSVLEKQELTNVVAVVTRYFGGIKLGTGGLIRAYGGCVANAIKEIGRVEVKKQEGIKLSLTYPQYQNLAIFLQSHQLQEIDTEFLEQVTTYIYLDSENIESILANLVEFYHGKITFEKAGHKIIEVPF